MSPLRALWVGLAAGAAALGASAMFAQTLHDRALAVSHELPPPVKPFVPPDAPRDVLFARGRKLYLNSCSHCHGEDARGDEGPDLHGLEISDRRIATVIARGIKGEMPSFAKKHGVEDTAALIVYLRSL
jgi:mono/diheme cytochrome c family protein